MIVASVAAVAVVALLVLAGVIRSLLVSNKALTRALVARTPQELMLLEHAAAQVDEPSILPSPFPARRPKPMTDDDYDDDPRPLGL